MTETNYITVTVECNNVKCKSHWTITIPRERINGNRLYGLVHCPVCGRYDSPYVFNSNTAAFTEKLIKAIGLEYEVECPYEYEDYHSQPLTDQLGL